MGATWVAEVPCWQSPESGRISWTFTCLASGGLRPGAAEGGLALPPVLLPEPLPRGMKVSKHPWLMAGDPLSASGLQPKDVA